MTKIVSLIMLALFTSGCATYKFQVGTAPYDKGYVVLRDNRVIPEYTIGKDNTAPSLELARSRFRRRRRMIEDFYKKMEVIENRFKENVADRTVFFLGFIKGVLSTPGRLISDYRYENNPEYRKKIDEIESQKETQEQARIQKLKAQLSLYIEQDLLKEGDVPKRN